MLKSTLILLSIVLALFVATPAEAICNRYDCRRTVDRATCWVRYGPDSKRFPLGTTCEGFSQCIWTYTADLGWVDVCYHDCEIVQCYEI